MARRATPSPCPHQYTAKDYRAKQAYNIDKWWFGLASNLFTLALTLATLLLGYMPWLWDTSGTLLAHVPQLPQGTIARSIVCFLIDGFLRTIIGLPWSAYSAFVVEQRHGFNKQTVGTFITDVLKKVGRLML